VTIYLDNAATTWPKPEAVYQAMDHYHRQLGGSPNRGSSSKTLEAGGVLLDTREALAELFHFTDVSRLIFTKNITEALNTVLKGYLKAGDHIIISAMEHNAVVRPLSKLTNSGVAVSIVGCTSDGSLDPQDVEKAWQVNTRMVCLTAASNVTGTLMPVKEVGLLCRAKDAVMVVDAAQSAGIIPIDVNEQNIDILTFTGHKSLFGPQGTGGFYVRPGLDLDSLIEGGTGSASESMVQPDFWPDKFESGTPNTPGIAGLGAGVNFILAKGLAAIRSHELELMDALVDGLKQIPGITMYGPADNRQRTAVLSINLAGLECGELGFLLEQNFGIITRSGFHCAPLAHQTIGTLQQGACRLSLSYFSTREQIDALLEGMLRLRQGA